MRMTGFYFHCIFFTLTMLIYSIIAILYAYAYSASHCIGVALTTGIGTLYATQCNYVSVASLPADATR